MMVAEQQITISHEELEKWIKTQKPELSNFELTGVAPLEDGISVTFETNEEEGDEE